MKPARTKVGTISTPRALGRLVRNHVISGSRRKLDSVESASLTRAAGSPEESGGVDEQAASTSDAVTPWAPSTRSWRRDSEPFMGFILLLSRRHGIQRARRPIFP